MTGSSEVRQQQSEMNERNPVRIYDARDEDEKAGNNQLIMKTRTDKVTTPTIKSFQHQNMHIHLYGGTKRKIQLVRKHDDQVVASPLKNGFSGRK